jgi:hypothetical protein
MSPKHDSPIRAAPRRIPSFHVIPGCTCGDGWTPVEQAEFIGELAETRSVTEVARRVGIARLWPISAENTAPISKVTNVGLAWRCETGIWSVIQRRGKYVGVLRKADDSALLGLVARTDRLARRSAAEASAGEKSRV